MNDDLKSLGYRARPRMEETPAGRISRDERGNTVYAWNEDILSLEGEEGDKARHQALDHPGLSMAEEEPEHNAPIRHNSKGLRVGYNPYESGMLSSKAQPVRKKTDLRELSKWLELKKRMATTGEE